MSLIGAGSQPAIAICTFKRPKGLLLLLKSLSIQGGIEHCPLVIVVDNSVDSEAEEVCASFTRLPTLRYCKQPSGGLVAARNRAILEVEYRSAVIFIDDDETACQGWYQAFLDGYALQPDGVLAGPVLPSFEVDPPDWVTRLRLGVRQQHPDGASVEMVGDGNTLLPLRLVADTRLRYDPKFASSGGADTDLFFRWKKLGGEIYWVQGAAVFENVPPTRMTATYAISREMWVAASYTMITSRTLSGLARAVARLPYYIGQGLMYFVLSVFTMRRDLLVRSGMKFGRVLGVIRSFVGFMPNRFLSAQDDTSRG